MLEKDSGDSIKAHKLYIKLLTYLLEELDKTRLITIAKPFLAGHKPYERDIYSRIFSPTIKPDFMFTKLMASYPKGGVEPQNYDVGEVEVVVFLWASN